MKTANDIVIALLAFLAGGAGLWLYKTFFADRRNAGKSVEMEKHAAKAEALEPIIEKLKTEVIRDTKDFNERLAKHRAKYGSPGKPGGEPSDATDRMD